MKVGVCATILLLVSAFAGAQGPNAPSAAVSPDPLIAPSAAETAGHKFWDRQTILLFSLHAGLEAADFGLTHHALANGQVERNPLARPFTNLGTGGQAAFFAGGTAATLGLTYWLHKRGHHRLERIVGMYAIADSGFGVIHNAMYPPHTSITPAPIRPTR
jgi:hypothetical protein